MHTLAAAAASTPTPIIDWSALVHIIAATALFGAGTVAIYSLGLVLLSSSAAKRSTSPTASATMRLGAYVTFAGALAIIAYGVSILLAK